MKNFALFLILLSLARPGCAFDKTASEQNLKSFAGAFESDRMYNNLSLPEYRAFYNADSQTREFLKEQYSASTDTTARMAAVFLFVKCWPNSTSDLLADAEHSSDGALRDFARRLRIYLGNMYEAPAPAPANAEEVKSASSADPARFVTVLVRALETGKPDFIAAALGRAALSKDVAFGEKGWPIAVAKAFKKSTGDSAKLLSEHLDHHTSLMSAETQAEVKKIINPAPLNPPPTIADKVAAWNKAQNGTAEFTEEVKKLSDGKHDKELIALIDAVKEKGSQKLLPPIANFLDAKNEAVGAAALKAFEAHTKSLNADLRNPQAAYVWWMVNGKHVIK